uniref:hypothetical protein n=1 Tax=Pseudofabraea citricarpa TaxID=1664388 RepID=UPI0022FD8A6C|nr:hypothetical protein PN052_mgp28 [Pseudofabraea citricarpa]WAX38799.1 hypothetical protein [Pseudofabraea citricarpa]
MRIQKKILNRFNPIIHNLALALNLTYLFNLINIYSFLDIILDYLNEVINALETEVALEGELDVNEGDDKNDGKEEEGKDENDNKDGDSDKNDKEDSDNIEDSDEQYLKECEDRKKELVGQLAGASRKDKLNILNEINALNDIIKDINS